MSGDTVWVSGDSIFGLGKTVDGLTAATPLGVAKVAECPAFSWDMVTGLIPGSIGETSVIANCHCYRCRYPVMVGRGKLENDAVSIRWWCRDGLGVQPMGTGYRSGSHALV